MRLLFIMIAVLTTGCASSNKDLIKDSRASGDWTAVNYRLDSEAEREHVDASCRSGFVLMCSDGCMCVQSESAFSRIEEIRGTRPGAGRDGLRRDRR